MFSQSVYWNGDAHGTQPAAIGSSTSTGEAILRFVQTIEIPEQIKELHKPVQIAPDRFDDRLLRITEAAQILSLGRSMVYELIYSGRLPSVKIGSARRLKLSEVMKLLDGVE